jgi:transcriptional regulator with XRE-family HTH domain
MAFKKYPGKNPDTPRYPNLVKLREERGLSPSEMAGLLGITKSYYSMIEGGDRKLSPRMALRASTVLECDPEYLLETAGRGGLID